MVVEYLGNNEGIVAGDVGSHAKCRLHEAALSGPGATASGTCAAGAATGAVAAGCASRCTGNYTGIYASRKSACLGAQNIHLRDGQVIARNDEVQIVLESEIDCV